MTTDIRKKHLRLLHTSDWHIGRALYGRKRYDEHEAFLDWLADCIDREQVDALLVAGDVFDTTTPTNRAQELYYRFLTRVAASRCRHVVVTAGNHDSPSFLEAPRSVLRCLEVHVIGQCAGSPEEEALALRDRDGAVELIVCAVPFLRERDMRISEAGETREDKERKLVAGISDHYRQVCAVAVEIRERYMPRPPIVAMGHLFAAGGAVTDEEGVREIYVGTLAKVGADAFPDCINYLALGHLHTAQRVGGKDHFRYSGAPLPMGFGETAQEKQLLLVDFEGETPTIAPLPIPRFQQLERVTGDMDAIGARIEALKDEGSKAWLEIVYDGDAIPGDLRATLEEHIAGSPLEILRVKNNRAAAKALVSVEESETLEELDVHEVFRRCLDANEIPAEQREELEAAYREIVVAFQEEDVRAE